MGCSAPVLESRIEKGCTAMNQDTYRDWYGTHGDDYNEKRREKYQADEALQQNARDRAKRYRNDDTPPELVDVGGVSGYSVRDTAKVLGKPMGTFSRHVSDGLIPAASLRLGKRKFYTESQISMIKDFYKVADRYYGRAAQKNRAAIDRAAQQLHDNWS